MDPHDLPPSAFTYAQNVRFRNGRVTSAPVFKQVFALPVANPRFSCDYTPSQGLDYLLIGYESGQVFRYANGAQTDYSITSYVTNTVEATWTSTFLADTIYVNRSDRAPWSLNISNANFQSLANMDSAWTCQLLRTCGGALVALNVTKGATTYQTMVKTSSLPTAGSVPASWDITLPNTNASENILAQMQGPIVDACPLGQTLCIYGQQEVWQMVPTGDFNLFAYGKLPFSKGALNANCSIEINSQNFVFGQDDIWVHDGVSERSIVDQKDRDFIFGSLSQANYSRCFVTHNKQLHEIHFNYPSNDGFTAFVGVNTPNGCNRCAVYDYVNGTWTFDDRPVVYGAALANLDNVKTWATETLTWASSAGTWASLDNTGKKVLAYIGDTASVYGLTASLYAFDPYSSSLTGMPAAVTNYAPTPAACGTPYLERSSVDMTALGGDLRDYTQISGIWPLARIDASTTATIDFSVGSADYYDQSIIYSPWQGYDGEAFYKIDVNMAGRYLSYKVRFLSIAPFSWSGFDFDTQVLGSR